MPSFNTPPPQRQISSTQTRPPPQLPPIVPPGTPTNGPYSNHAPTSPVAPEFSPITPKAQPALPATYSPQAPVGPDEILSGSANGQVSQPQGAIAPTAQYIPQPPPQPFSSEDATDAIALRAAISSLQFQKKKAHDDIRELERIRKKALNEPALFKSELAAGRLNEQRPKVASLQSILDEADSDDDDEDEVMLGATNEEETHSLRHQNGIEAEVPDSQQTSRPSTSSSAKANPSKDNAPPFGQIPGPQNIVRMPYVNWDKYHISGESLDALHEQQRKWPGTFNYGQDRGREHVVAAPYSPWLDSLDGPQQGWDERRNDSVNTPGTAVTPTTTISEHPMETRRKQIFQ